MPEIVVDEAADAAYLYVGGVDETRSVARTELTLGPRNEMVNLDYDADGYLIGVELIPATALLRPSDR
jgi:uncharacterized protein YuzE